MERLQPLIKFLNKPFGVYEFKGISVEPRYWMAGAIVVLVFLLLLSLARLRYEYVHWSVSKPSLAMIFWGFIIAILFEGLLMVFGKTMFTEILGWKNAPKPISTIIDIGRNKFVTVMGASDEKASYKSVVTDYESLSDKEGEKVKDYICK
ncbi:MAG: hypothetical protein US62_C0004G0009 [Candidatus Woesebacteria bacterium GW2011_GWA1_37_8]|uniref:Uncharacterized protein n=2 Tax=Candidatus Woeseibacteriota TaxID=1752722 RepID=A0A0G0L9F6_9BACT|nr:MAG: hypothetical protein US39_C0010G0037 [Microgenomates group bacterium GW2011_GWC1_37_12b]KKQ46196.1 MAG: hypothetical protein US62_C0004G0009 [Candidatus Woesebacteria bacterium GW2011_GWA1_37_8]KKQ87607.1 MAG: hypothetical protein UT10_C0003G0011 [Candidatus Woesebacteria bacterium GW2011_GWB1_38_8b]